MPTKLVPGTSLFVTIFITAMVVVGHALQFKTIDFVLVLTLISGSIIGLHIGHKLSQKLNASEYKTLLAILLLGVGLMMGIETLVLGSDENLFIDGVSGKIDTKLAEIIFLLSNNYPITYAFLSIIIVVIIGISFSYARELVHYMRYNVDKKKYNIFN